jgi:hypothetical protein
MTVAPPAVPTDVLTPLRLPEDLPLTPEQFTADGSVLSPDASLLRLVRWDALTAEQRRGFPPLCPDLVVELASTSGASAADEGPAGLAADPRTAGGGGVVRGRWRQLRTSAPGGCQ